MEEIDFNRYKAAWTTEEWFQEAVLSEAEIRDFMQSTSKNVMSYKRALLFDIFFKLILLLAFCCLAILIQNNAMILTCTLLVVLIVVLGVTWQHNVYREIPNTKEIVEDLISLLRTYIDFYHRLYFISIFINALSSCLLFLGGSLFYLYFKYERIPDFALDDYVVLSIGLIGSYALSAIAQIRQGTYQVRQWETCLEEIEGSSLSKSMVDKIKSSRTKNKILVGVLLIFGLLLLLLLIYRSMP